jgi:hypothetical protein
VTAVRSIVAALAVIASAGALTACGSPAPAAPAASGTAFAGTASPGTASASAEPASSTSAGSAADSLTTSLTTAEDDWAVVPVSANPRYWQVLVRPVTSAAWRLVTPPGVADNGGLVAATAAGSLTVAVRPSQNLLFSPLASTANAGTTWSAPAPLSAGVAASPGALAASGRQLLAVLDDGAITASSDAGASWRTLAKPGAIAASAAGKACGTVAVTSVSFGLAGSSALAAGRCGATGTAGLFARSLTGASGDWTRVSLPVAGQLVRLLAGSAVLVQTKAGLTALWGNTGWYAYAPLTSAAKPAAGWTASPPLPVIGAVAASGELAGEGAWVLLPGGQAATIAGPGRRWLLLPPAPAGTAALSPGTGGAIDALAVSGATLTIWRLVPEATVWVKIQAITVPIQYGSSS